jgi:hypothetical protein
MIIHLNTKDSQTSDNASSMFNLNRLPKSKDKKKLSLQSIEFANMIYPITRYNRTLYFQEDSDTGTTYSGNININNIYDGNTFATEIQRILNAETGNAYDYSVSYSTTTKKLTISEDSNNPFKIVAGDNNCNDLMGMNTSIDTSFETSSFELRNPIDITGTKYFDVMSNINTVNFTSTSTSNILMRVPVSVNFGEILYYEPKNLHYINIDDFEKNLELQLRDDLGKIIELSSNCYISYTFRLDE